MAEKGGEKSGHRPVARRPDHQAARADRCGGPPFALTLTASKAADIIVAPALLARAERVKYLIADKGYDGDGLRSASRQAGAVPVILGHANRKRKVRLDARRYRDPHLVENAVEITLAFRRSSTHDVLQRPR